MDLPNGQSIRMHAACRIVATISLDEHKDSSLALAQVPLQLRDYPYTVTMPDLGEADFLKIMAKTAPRLKSMRKSLVSTFFTVSRLIRQEKTSMDRPLSSKDFFRAVARLLALEDLLDGRAIFLELLELWAMHLRGSGLRRRVAAAIGQALSLSEEEQNYFLDTRQPEVRVEGDNNKCHFGRATLERRAQESRFAGKMDGWTKHKSSCSANRRPTLCSPATQASCSNALPSAFSKNRPNQCF
jgi:hypothetical protein